MAAPTASPSASCGAAGKIFLGQVCTISCTLPTSMVKKPTRLAGCFRRAGHLLFRGARETLGLREPLSSCVRRSTNMQFLQFRRRLCDLHESISTLPPSLVRLRWTRAVIQRIKPALRYWPKSIIMSLGAVAERYAGQRLLVSFLVFCQMSSKRLDPVVQQARAGLRSILPPAPSLE